MAIDPGNAQSAYVIWNKETKELIEKDKIDNQSLLELIDIYKDIQDLKHFAVEMIASYGMPVGKEIFDTVLWIGKFIDRWRKKHELIYRKDEKIQICGTMKAKDPNIRQAIIDIYGGKEVAIGNKKNPGLLYQVKADIWQALAVAITYEKLYVSKE